MSSSYIGLLREKIIHLFRIEKIINLFRLCCVQQIRVILLYNNKDSVQDVCFFDKPVSECCDLFLRRAATPTSKDDTLYFLFGCKLDSLCFSQNSLFIVKFYYYCISYENVLYHNLSGRSSYIFNNLMSIQKSGHFLPLSILVQKCSYDRSCIVEYLPIIQSGERKGKNTNFRPILKRNP